MPSPVVHKVSAIQSQNGKIYFKTAHENPEGSDPWLVPAEKVVGKFAGKIPYIGLPALYLKTPWGIALLAVLLAVGAFYTLC